MAREVVTSSRGPAAIGPYSQAIRVEGWIFVSGQIPLDPESGAVVDGDIEAQTRRVLDNLRAILADAGSGLEHVVKTTVFLKNLLDFSRMNEVYARYFPAPGAPARSTVEVSRLPRDVRIEIDAIARVA